MPFALRRDPALCLELPLSVLRLEENKLPSLPSASIILFHFSGCKPREGLCWLGPSLHQPPPGILQVVLQPHPGSSPAHCVPSRDSIRPSPLISGLRTAHLFHSYFNYFLNFIFISIFISLFLFSYLFCLFVSVSLPCLTHIQLLP